MSWAAVPLRRVASILGGGTPSADEQFWDGDVPFVTPPDLRPAHGGLCRSTGRTLTDMGATSGSTIAPVGSVMVSKRAPIGYVARLERESAFNQGCLAVVPNPAALRADFLTWALSVKGTELNVLGRGTTFMELSAGDLASAVLRLPTIDQQRAIGDYLDRETDKIDALIEKQQRLIATLRDRRGSQVAAVVYESQHPGSGRLKHAVTNVRQGWSPQCNAWPADGVGTWGVLKAGAANAGQFRPEENKELPDDEVPRPDTVVRAGEVIVSRANTRDLVGSAAVVVGDYPRLMLCDKLYAFALDPARADPEYVTLTLGTRRWRDLIELEATGASHSMQNISQADILNIPFNPPPVTEQLALVQELRAQTERIDVVVEKAEHLIELSRERRAALITAAVTGQIDVPGAA